MRRVVFGVLSVCYLVAAFLQILDVFDLRFHFSQMGILARTWTLYLCFSDLLAAMALWWRSCLGDLFFTLIVLTQLAVFVGWAPYLENQNFVVAFHFIALCVFLIALTYDSRRAESSS